VGNNNKKNDRLKKTLIVIYKFPITRPLGQKNEAAAISTNFD